MHPPEPKDPQLYAKVKAEADRLFLAPTSAYKSGWIVRTYKDRGGKYKSQSQTPNKKQEKVPTGLKRWFAEKWINLRSKQPDQPCGRPRATEKGIYPLCRPSIRVTKDTPVTASELTQKQIASAKRKKQAIKQHGHITF